jgi:hypothetical protein
MAVTWKRTPGVFGGTCGSQQALVLDGRETGWLVAHCGHPTALWPWAIQDPSGRLVIAPAVLGFQYLADAKQAAVALATGTVEPVSRHGHLCFPTWEGRAWRAINRRLAGRLG